MQWKTLQPQRDDCLSPLQRKKNRQTNILATQAVNAENGVAPSFLIRILEWITKTREIDT